MDARSGQRLIFGIEEWRSALAILLGLLLLGILVRDFTDWVLRKVRVE